MSTDAPIHECESEIDHYTGHYVPYSLRRVCGYFNVPDDANIVGYAASFQDALLSPPQRPRLWDMTLPRMSFQMAAILTTISLATVLI